MKNKSLGMFFCCILLLILMTGCGSADSADSAPEWITAVFSGDAISVEWNPVKAADNYRLYKKSSGDSEYKFICDTPHTVYTDTEWTPGCIYSYKVSAICSDTLSEGAESEPVTIYAAPEILSVQTITQDEIEIKWQDCAAVLYHVYAAEADGDWILAAKSDRLEYQLLNAGNYTRLCVSAVHDKGGSRTESPKSAEEPIPRGCSITSVTRVDNHTVAVLFESETDTGEYLISRSVSQNGEYTHIGRSFEQAFYDVDAEIGAEFYYRVQPVTAKGTGLLSEPAPVGKNARSISGVPVFMYHEFVTQTDLDNGIAFDEYAIWKDEFEQDLIWLTDNGYTTITTAQLAAYLNGTETLPEKPVILTIDDGKYGVYKNAYPLLEKYNMTAVLAVIGEQIDLATDQPESRATDPAPFCTWEEIGEMSRSGTVEIVSHTYTKHRYNYNGHRGADIAENEEEDAFYLAAKKDYQKMDLKLKEETDTGTLAMAYPYSFRSEAADRVWRRCGYAILLAGDSDSVRRSYYNYYVDGAGLNYYSARTRRIPRMTGTSLSQYIADAQAHDK